MTQRLRQLRERIDRTPVNRRGRRQYSEEQRQELLSYAAARQARGESYARIAEDLGMPDSTLLNWRDKTRQRANTRKQPVGFRPVALQPEKPDKFARQPKMTAPSKPSSRPVVILPSGICIEGVSLVELPELVRSLECSR